MSNPENIMIFPKKEINIISFNVDSSKFFQKEVSNILKTVVTTLKYGIEDNVSVAIALNIFDKTYKEAPFRGIEELTANYPLYDGISTALYDSIIIGAKNLLDYIEEVKKVTGITPNASFFTFSNSERYEDSEAKKQAKNSIKKLNLAGITTVFVDLNITYHTFGDDMGYTEKIYAAKKT